MTAAQLLTWCHTQLVWFLAPTVALCTQHHAVLTTQLPAVQSKLLSGADGVDRWTHRSLWDAVLKGVKIVVSTHQILLDALSHAFVKFGTLSLLVFDEGSSPFSVIRYSVLWLL